MRNQNLKTVFAFEVKRTLTKKSYWLSMVLLPLFLIIITAVTIYGGSMMAGNTTITSQKDIDSGKAQADALMHWTYVDPDQLINPDVAKTWGGTPNPHPERAAAQAIQDDQAVYIIHGDPFAIQAIAPTLGLLEDQKYHRIINTVLRESQDKTVPDTTKAIIQGSIPYSLSAFKDGKPSNLIGEALIPGLFLVIFYFTAAISSNYGLNATLEEKENRVSEVIFTTVKPYTLLMGKYLSILTLIGIQVVGMTVTVIGGMALLVPFTTYFLGSETGGTPSAEDILGTLPPVPQTPGISMATIGGVDIVFDPARIGIAVLVFIVGVFFTLTVVSFIGALAGNSKDAGQFMAPIIIGLMLPLMVFQLIMTSPDSWFVWFMHWFPLTQPMTVLIENAVGTTSLWPALGSVCTELAAMMLVMWMTVRVFRQGSLEYSGLRLRTAISIITSK